MLRETFEILSIRKPILKAIISLVHLRKYKLFWHTEVDKDHIVYTLLYTWYLAYWSKSRDYYSLKELYLKENAFRVSSVEIDTFEVHIYRGWILFREKKARKIFKWLCFV